jgi:EAL domain-containing protein (putative c-di-GMP-specific phosphodiesterase class I)
MTYKIIFKNVTYVFITKLLQSKSDRLFVKAMVDVARGMGIKTVAEFVENKGD